ncbi:MAG: succinylglutamate desuccinylase/aspartoacylase family protein [Longimicrobiales bacterium]|nr:succinylglutamate desuccinylase/aspartoacylase family protein [Longimicrobiales bacterium]
MSRSSGAVRAPLVIGGHEVLPGNRSRVELPVARFVTGEWLSLAVEAVHGAAEGPTVWLSGAIHGDELDGVEIVREVLAGLDPGEMAGTVLGVPVVNVFGFVAESRYLPDRRDLNRSFPGRPDGSMAARLAHLFMSEVVERCSLGLDFHCGSDDRENLPHIRANLEDAELRALALAFGAPLALHNRPPDGSLRKAAAAAGARTLVYEAGEAGRFTASAIEAGVAGTRRVLRRVGVTRSAPRARARTVVAVSSHWVRAPRSGICHVEAPLGGRVERGGTVGRVHELLGEEGVRIRAGSAGVVIGRRVNPLVYQGEAVLHLARPEEVGP